MQNNRTLAVQDLFQVQQPGDFITNIKYHEALDRLILIHQNNQIDVVPRNYDWEQSKKIKFQSNIYDAVGIGNNLIVSNKNMPVRVYNIEQQPKESLIWASIEDRKPNSEQFLTPLQISKCGTTVIGGGKKFTSQYDINKCCAKRLKIMDKKYVSAVQLLNENVFVSGQFTGELQLLDLREAQIISSTKPHLDLVTRIKNRTNWEHQFVTAARKDNFSYLWDSRNLLKFVQCFEIPRFKNQRSGMEISKDSRYLFLGGQNGQIFVFCLNGGEFLSQYNLQINACISSICAASEQIFCSAGQRYFPLEGQTPPRGWCYRLCQE